MSSSDRSITIRNAWRGAFLCLLSMGLAAGCVTVGPDFEVPESALDDDWLDSSRSAITSEERVDPEWWRSFNDPLLDDLVEMAYAQNLTLRVAALRIYESRALLGIASGSRYPQSQNVGASAGRQQLSRNAPPLDALPDDVRNNARTSLDVYQLGFDAAWEIDFWGRFRRNVEAAEAEFAASVAEFDDVLVMLTGEVAASYVTIRELEERLQVARDNVEIQQRGLDNAEILFANGATTELDAQQSRTILNATQALVVGLETEVRRARNGLAVLLGITPAELEGVLGPPGQLPPTPAELAAGIPADLLRRRPDIRRAEMAAAAQSARIGIARAEMLPAFVLGGDLGLQASSTGDLFESDSRVGFLGLGFSWPIFNYGRLENRVRAEDARFQASIASYQNTVLAAAREVEDALIGFVNAQQQADFLRDGVTAAEEAVRLSDVRYREGEDDFTRLLTAQQSLLEVQESYVIARSNIALNLIATYKALGGAWSMREGRELIPEDVRDEMRERTDWDGLLEPDETAQLQDEAEVITDRNHEN